MGVGDVLVEVRGEKEKKGGLFEVGNSYEGGKKGLRGVNE